MSISLVSLGSVESGFSPAPTFGQSTTAGNFLVAWLSSNSASATDPFVTSASGWTKVTAAAGNPYNWGGLWYKPDCSTGETAPAWSADGSTNRAQLAEFSGVATVSPLDSYGVQTSGGPTQVVTNTSSDSAADELIIVNATWTGNGTATTITLTINDSSGSLVTPNTTIDSSGNSPEMNYVYGWGIAGSTGVSQDTATGVIGMYSGGCSTIASFKVGAAAPTGPKLFMIGIV